MDFGKRIKEKREELGLTQEELATMMGYKSKSSINKIELGLNDVSSSKVAKFASVLGTTIPYLMGWEENAAQGEKEMFLGMIEKLNTQNREHLAKYMAYLINEQGKEE